MGGPVGEGLGEMRGDGQPAAGIVAAIQPQLPPRRQQRREAPGQALHAAGPFGAGDAFDNRGLGQPKRVPGAECRDGDAGIVGLVGAGQAGGRRGDPCRRIRPGQPGSRLVGHVPVPAPPQQGRAAFRRHAFQHRQHLGGLGAGGAGDAVLDDPGLLEGDLGQRVAQEVHVVHGDAGDRGGGRPIHHIGRVEPPAKPDLQHQQVGRDRREQVEGDRRRHLEHRDGFAGIDAFHMLQRLRQRILAHQCASQPDAFVEADQVGGGVDMHPEPRRFRDGAQEGAGRSLAIGAGHMDHRRQAPFGIAEGVEAGLHAPEAEVDQLRVQAVQPFDDGLAARGGQCRHLRPASQPRRPARAPAGRVGMAPRLPPPATASPAAGR